MPLDTMGDLMQDGLDTAQGAAALSSPAGGAADGMGDAMGDSMEAPVLGTTLGGSFSLLVGVGYVPSAATAALTVTQGALTFPLSGAYPATVVLNADGTYSLSYSQVSAPAGLVAGAVTVQPGDLAGGVFTPNGPPVAGVLNLDAAVSPFLANLPPPPAPIYAFQPSGAMIRDEMRRLVQTILGETRGTAGDMEPATLDKYLTAAADTLARETYCLYQSVSVPIVPGQADYCAPPLFKIAGAFVTDPLGTIYPLREATRRDLDARYGAAYPFYGWGNSWRNAAPDVPEVYLWDSLSGISLFPPPLFPPPSGPALLPDAVLTAEGWATTEGLWDYPADFCPLPARSHMTVVDGAVLLRAAQMPGTANLAMIERRYQASLASLEREAATYARRRTCAPAGYGFSRYGVY